MKTSTICQNDRRREQVRAGAMNGLDYLEVSEDQVLLTIYFLGKAPAHLTSANVQIEGGRRVQNLRVIGVQINRVEDPELDDSVEVTVDRPGDFSTYTLRLINDPKKPENDLLAGVDPRYRCLQFSFKAGCPSDLDCPGKEICPPTMRDEPEINYLAKDYASFRQLMLDRLALLLPDWRESHVPDLGITLVELLAYTGDHLSYYQDAVGTEAYLKTARQRISVRRHARLVDYLLHEGCNARAWICIAASSDITLDARETYFITGLNDVLPVGDRVLTPDDLRNVPPSQYEVFEPLLAKDGSQLAFFASHNAIYFYTWGNAECCLPRGATRVTLRDDWAEAPPPPPVIQGAKRSRRDKRDDSGGNVPAPEAPRKLHLQVGDVLIFEELIGPETGNPADADPTRRHAVRLTKVEPAVDKLFNQPILEIEWAAEDALPFPFCLSVVGPANVPPDQEPCELIENVSVARGNVVLIDHGRTIEPSESLGPVAAESTEVYCEGECHPSEVTIVPARFRPALAQAPLTFRQPLPCEVGGKCPASRLVVQDPRLALPEVALNVTAPPTSEPDWVPRRDLLSSDPTDRHFVAEIDNDGRAHLRFGDGELGLLPQAGTIFAANYRAGNGKAGNVGAEAISRLVLRRIKLDGVTLTPRNPLPASGGTDAEPLAEVKLYAPHTFRKELQRAITAEDYARLAERHPKVQRAAAVLRWTGSWYEAQVAIDPKGTESVSMALLQEIERHLHPFRRIGHDLRVLPARYVSLNIEMIVCVQPQYLRGHVEAALLQVFASGVSPDGQPGFFHPDRLSFGCAIFLSQLVALARGVTGVDHVRVTRLERLFVGPNHEIDNGLLRLGPLEVARLDNDPGNPENGRLNLIMRGGR